MSENPALLNSNVRGQWRYLYRAIDSNGETDASLSLLLPGFN